MSITKLDKALDKLSKKPRKIIVSRQLFDKLRKKGRVKRASYTIKGKSGKKDHAMKVEFPQLDGAIALKIDGKLPASGGKSFRLP